VTGDPLASQSQLRKDRPVTTDYVPERRRADELRTGDRIIPGYPIGAGSPEEVLFVHLFPGRGRQCAYLVLQYEGEDRPYEFICGADERFALSADSGAKVPEGVVGQAIGRASVHTAEGAQ
jgi:hypothetical protein